MRSVVVDPPRVVDGTITEELANRVPFAGSPDPVTYTTLILYSTSAGTALRNVRVILNGVPEGTEPPLKENCAESMAIIKGYGDELV